MPQSKECKGCMETVRISQQEIEAIFGKAFKVKNVKLATENVYNERLSICLSCESLDYGTTCRHCGCIVQVKAKLAAAKCPMPYSPKWQPV